MDLFQCLKGENWREKQAWGFDDYDVRHWFGISVGPANDPSEGQVTGISMPNNNVSGKIPDSICKLPFLEWVDLSNNYITGGGDMMSDWAFPSCINKLTKLRKLNLNRNLLDGLIPPEIGKCAQLRELRLEENRVYGKIPMTLGLCHELRLLYLNSNNMTGRIPDSLGQCVHMEYLWLDNNEFIGDLPRRISNMKRLSTFNICYNFMEYRNERGIEEMMVEKVSPNIRMYLSPQKEKPRIGKGAHLKL